MLETVWIELMMNKQDYANVMVTVRILGMEPSWKMNKIMPMWWMASYCWNFWDGAKLKYEQDYYADVMAMVIQKYMKVSFTTLRLNIAWHQRKLRLAYYFQSIQKWRRSALDCSSWRLICIQTARCIVKMSHDIFGGASPGWREWIWRVIILCLLLRAVVSLCEDGPVLEMTKDWKTPAEAN